MSFLVPVSDAVTHYQLTRVIDLLAKILERLTYAVGVTFKLKGADMAVQTGNNFTIPDTSPASPFTLVAMPQDQLGGAAVVTNPAYTTSGLDPTIIQGFTSTDGLTASFNLPSPAKVGTTTVNWSGMSSNSSTINGTVTLSVTSGAAVSVTFQLTTP